MAISGVTGAQSVIRPGVCTSTTRPASPYDGQVIYETDTNKTLAFNGSVWDILSDMGAWTAYTPVLTNATLGNGTITGFYSQIGKIVVGRVSFTFGSTSSLSGSGLAVTLPITAVNATCVTGNLVITDSGSGWFYGAILPDTTSRVVPVVYNTSTTYATIAGLTTAVPMTWANLDNFVMSFIYEAA